MPNESVTYPLNSDAAAWSFALGILSLLGGLAVTGLPAVILGHIAGHRIRRNAPRLIGRGYARAGLIAGYLSLLVTALLWPHLRALFSLLFELIETQRILHGS